MSNSFPIDHRTAPQPWVRLWLPEPHWNANPGIDDDFLSEHGQRGGTEHLLDEPLSGIGTLSDFKEASFLFLLGRPGSGKSSELGKAKKFGWFGDHCAWIEGKEFGSDIAGTLDRLIGHTPEIDRLCIDGLDEALLEQPQFVSKLKRWLLSHLRPNGEPKFDLLLTCRWADWPTTGVDELAALWKADQSKKLMLCPLRQKDVVATLKQRFSDDIDSFWEQMNFHHLRPVACWPQGLIGLMEQFERSGRTKVCRGYSQAVEDQIATHIRLADSPEEPGRWIASLAGADWRHRVAGRLAASMTWSGKSKLDLRPAPTSDDVLACDDFHEIPELWEDTHKPVRLEDLDAVVHKTRLMRRLSDDIHWVFQSQVHQEFLAAEWLNSHGLDELKLRQLFGRDLEGTWRVQPALGAVAAWLAVMNPTFRQLLLNHDPLVLLRMDGSRLPDKEREAVLEALLQATERIRVIDPAIRQAHLASLSHPDLHRQLANWLCRTDACDAAKELAIEIAEKTKLHSLATLLWELYPTSHGRLQVEMAGALYRLATSADHETRWLSVLRGDLPIDKHGSILGAAIELLILSGKTPVHEALHWFIPGMKFDVYGLYDMAVRSLSEKLTPEDLPVVFAKLGEKPEWTWDSLKTPHHIHKAAVRLAIQQFNRPEVAHALCDYWYACLKQHVHPHHSHNENWSADKLGIRDDEHRRLIIKSLTDHPDFARNTEKKWLFIEDYLFTSADIDWVLDELETANTEDRWKWALAFSTLMWQEELTAQRGERLQLVWLSLPEIRGYFPQPSEWETLPEAILRFDKECKAKRKAEQGKWRKKWDRQEAKFKADLVRYTDECKTAHEQGRLIWTNVFHLLSGKAHGRGPQIITFEPIKQIGSGDEWMIEAAIRYLVELPNHRKIVLEDGIDGLLALATCVNRVEGDANLAEALRCHWLAPILACLSMGSLGETPEGVNIEQLAEWFPEHMPPALTTVIRHRYQKGGELGEIRSFKKVWSDIASQQLSHLLMDEPIQPAGFFNAMHHLAEKEESLAVEVIRFWLAQEVGKLSHDQMAVMAGAGLFLLDGRLATEIQESGLMEDMALARDAIWRSVHPLRYFDRNPEFSKWSDESIRIVGNLCCRAYTRLERDRSPERGFHAVTGEDAAVEYRDRVISEATQRGIFLVLPTTHEEDSPQAASNRLRWIDWHRNEASKARLKAYRELISPPALAKFCSTPQARLARNNDELMEAVIASLKRWENDVKAGNWRRIWDLKPLRSREEEDIAKEVRDWLRDDLRIITEREVELSSERRTDILVQTLRRTSEKLTVLIELKKVRKANNRERRLAMKSQLRDTYLKERLAEGWTHGLYVVAWTPDPNDKLDSDAAMEAESQVLAKQAAHLSEPPFTLKSLVVDARSKQ